MAANPPPPCTIEFGNEPHHRRVAPAAQGRRLGVAARGHHAAPPAGAEDHAPRAPRRADRPRQSRAVPRAAQQALLRLVRGQGFAVLCLDLDHFKAVNDTLGHPVGDALLKQVSERLLSCVRQGDIVARLGGDEFAIIQANVRDPGQTEIAGRAHRRDRSARPTRSTATASTSAPASASRWRRATAATPTSS